MKQSISFSTILLVFVSLQEVINGCPSGTTTTTTPPPPVDHQLTIIPPKRLPEKFCDPMKITMAPLDVLNIAKTQTIAALKNVRIREGDSPDYWSAADFYGGWKMLNTKNMPKLTQIEVVVEGSGIPFYYPNATDPPTWNQEKTANQRSLIIGKLKYTGIFKFFVRNGTVRPLVITDFQVSDIESATEPISFKDQFKTSFMGAFRMAIKLEECSFLL